MDDDLQRLLTLVDHGDDGSAVERWFTAVEESFRNSDGEAESWDAFADRFREQASGFDSGTVTSFLERADGAFGNPLNVVERFCDEVGAGNAVSAYSEARADEGNVIDADEGGVVEGEPGWERFGAFLWANQEYMQASWDDLQEYLVYQARAEGFGVEIDSFVDYIAAMGGDHVAAFEVYVGAPLPGGGLASHPGDDPVDDEPEPTPETAAADALALARRALESLQAQFPDTLIEVSDEQLIAILDSEINAIGGV